MPNAISVTVENLSSCLYEKDSYRKILLYLLTNYLAYSPNYVVPSLHICCYAASFVCSSRYSLIFQISIKR